MLTAVLLGTAQDGGLPQPGCACANCAAVAAGALPRRHVVCLGLADREAKVFFLIDATPDFREQYTAMRTRFPECAFGGLLLTHAHMGHYTGLMFLGFEAMGLRELPVYATPSLAAFLRQHAPWRQLVEQRNITLREIAHDLTIPLTMQLRVTPFKVPHRDEWSDTVGYVLRGAQKSLLYLPDIDGWKQWARPVREAVDAVSVALLDATFYSADELPNGAVARIGHPLATETAALLSGTKCDVRLIHLNHTNPLHREGSERAQLISKGVKVANEGDVWEL